MLQVPALAGLVVMLFVVPTYSSSGGAASSNGVVSGWSSSSTVFAANPQAGPTLISISALGALLVCTSLVVAWWPTPRVRYVLLALSTIFTLLTLLAIASIGIFMLPLVACAWIVVACGRRASVRDLRT